MDSPSQLEERRGVLGWVLRHPKSVIALVMFLMLALAVLALQRSAENALARRIAAIKAKGEPTSVADLLARQRHIPDEENTLVAMVKNAYPLLPVKLATELDAHLPIVGTDKMPPTGARWSEIQLNAAGSYLGQHRSELAALHRALMLKRSSYDISWKTPAISTLLPELSWIRLTGKTLSLETLTAVQTEEKVNADAIIINLLPMMQLMDGSDILIAALVQIGVSAQIQDTIERTINFSGLEDSTLSRIELALRAAESFPDMKTAFQGERVCFLDTMQWMRTSAKGPGQLMAMTGGGVSAIGHAWRYVPGLPALDIASGLDLYNGMVDALDRPDMGSISRVTAAGDRIQSMEWYSVFSKHLIPYLSRSVVLWVRSVGQNRALRAAVAAERYRLATGHWPESIGEVVPKYLDAVPIDPMDGKPIRFAIIPEGIKTWTIAGEGHDEDNGGDVQRIESKQQRGKDLGWVILNPELRGRPAPEERPATKAKSATSKTADN